MSYPSHPRVTDKPQFFAATPPIVPPNPHFIFAVVCFSTGSLSIHIFFIDRPSLLFIHIISPSSSCLDNTHPLLFGDTARILFILPLPHTPLSPSPGWLMDQPNPSFCEQDLFWHLSLIDPCWAFYHGCGTANVSFDYIAIPDVPLFPRYVAPVIFLLDGYFWLCFQSSQNDYWYLAYQQLYT